VINEWGGYCSVNWFDAGWTTADQWDTIGAYDVYSQGCLQTGCMDSVALNYDGQANDSCADCCMYPCCNDAAYSEYSDECTDERHSPDECVELNVVERGTDRGITVSSDAVTIQVPGKHTFSVIDLKGATVFSGTGSNVTEYSLNYLEPGVYVIKVTAAGLQRKKTISRLQH
jgi:hypothetical protein